MKQSHRYKQDGFSQVPNSWYYRMHELNISTTDFLVMLVILAHKFSDDMPYPSAQRIAMMIGKEPKTVHRSFRSLVNNRVLRSYRRSGLSNEYDFTPIEERLGKLPSTLDKNGGTPRSKMGKGPTPKMGDKEYPRRININNRPESIKDIFNARYIEHKQGYLR